jgi:hypothetical protein
VYNKNVGHHDLSLMGQEIVILVLNEIKFSEGGRLMDFEGYCVKCREKRQIKGGRVEVNEKGRRMAKGVCHVCGTNVTRFLPKEDPK